MDVSALCRVKLTMSFDKTLSFFQLYKFFKEHKRFLFNKDILQAYCPCERFENLIFLVNTMSPKLNLTI